MFSLASVLLWLVYFFLRLFLFPCYAIFPVVMRINVYTYPGKGMTLTAWVDSLPDALRLGDKKYIKEKKLRSRMIRLVRQRRWESKNKFKVFFRI